MAEAIAPTWAFVTPSYSGDYRRCLLLCRSMDALLAGNWVHYVVVDRPHFAMFKHLQSPRRQVLVTDDVLPGKMRLLFHMPFLGGRSVWWSRSGGFAIGWHLQQMVKIGIASHLSEDGIAYCDSDTFFLKPFDTAALSEGKKIRLYRSPSAAKVADGANPAFMRAALNMLHLPIDASYHGYIDNFVTWRRQDVLELQSYLGQKNHGQWQRAFRNRINFSEYNLYGLYVEKLGRGQDTHFATSEHLCKTHWLRSPMNGLEVAGFCGSLKSSEVMVGIQSFAGIEMALLEQQFEQCLTKVKLV